MGFEYMFFDEALRDRFVAFAADCGIASAIAQSVENPIDGPLCRKPPE